MTLTFLSPLAGLVGLLALLGIAALVRSERRSRRLCAVLGLRPRSRLAPVVRALAIAAAGALLGIAAAQPVVAEPRLKQGRTDAGALFVFDISRSMLARSSLSSPSRFDRARKLAVELRAQIPEVPAGVASLTDRVLPLLFPTPDESAFDATVTRALGIERPPPDRSGHGRATSLAALGNLGRLNFFAPNALKRVAVVLTDGESLPVNVPLLRDRLDQGGIKPVFIRVWAADERVFDARGRPAAYRPDPASGGALSELATAVFGRAVGEGKPGRALDAIRSAVGEGPTGPAGRELHTEALAPYAVLAAGLPLLFLLWRRNLRTVPG
jgi:hypothetical protein